MPLDLSSLPLAEVKIIYEVITGKRALSLDLIPVLTKLIDWAYEHFLVSAPAPAIGSAPGEVDDAAMLAALIDGDVVDEETKGGLVGGIVASLAIKALVRIAKKLLAELLESQVG